MRAPQRVVWTEGMLMRPQHLQQADRYHEQLLSARLAAVSPYDWGVLAVEIDERALAAGQVRVQKFVGVLPDGTPLAFDASHAEAPPTRTIEGHFAPTARALEVYVALPAEREGVSNYSPKAAASAAQSGTRFTVEPRTVYDGAAGGAEAEVQFAQRNVVVLFGDEVRESFDAVKVAEVVRSAGGALTLREAFVPPARRISASPFLLAGMQRLLTLMIAKQRTLAEARRQRDASTVEFGAGDITRFLLLNAINTFLPVVAHLLDGGESAPETAYLLLCQFAGQLATFAADEEPTTLPKFRFTDLGATFEELYARITRLLQMTVRDRYRTVPLETRDDGLHFGRLDDDELLRATTWVLAVRSVLSEQQVVEQLPRLSKIASWNDIGGIVQSATPGVPLKVSYRPPAEIPVRAGFVYFALATADRFWRNVVGERAIAIYLPPPFDPASVTLELLVVPGNVGGASLPPPPR